MFITYPHIETENVEYAFALGRIRALESRLFTTQKIARLIETKDAEDLLKSLTDTHYSQYLPSNPHLYEDIIKNKRKEVYPLMEILIIDPFLVQVLRLKYDYHNVKVFLKSKIKGEKVPDIYEAGLLSDFGNIERKELEDIFEQERYDKLGFGLSEGIEDAISSYYSASGGKDPRLLDICIDRSYYTFLVNNLKNVFFATLVKIEIDLINIKTVFRLKWLNEELSLLAKALLDGGYIDYHEFLGIFEDSVETWTRKFQATPYYEIIDQRGKEKFCDDHYLNFLRTTKYMSFGVEPVISYFYAIENELKILRMLFVGKLNGIPNELIKERLPEVY